MVSFIIQPDANDDGDTLADSTEKDPTDYSKMSKAEKKRLRRIQRKENEKDKKRMVSFGWILKLKLLYIELTSILTGSFSILLNNFALNFKGQARTRDRSFGARR